MELLIILLSALACTSVPIQPNSGTTTPTTLICGVPAVKPDTDSNIYGGTDVVPYSWPWQADIQYPGHAYMFDPFCGGSLISDQWVITAAECFFLTLDENPSHYKVKLGAYNRKEDEPGSVLMDVEEIIKHPKWNIFTARYDIALIKLSSPVNFTDHISPVCLPPDGQDIPAVGTPSYLTGWGETKTAPSGSNTLQQVMLPLVSADTCKKANPDLYHDEYFCAGYQEGGKGPCFADMGAPLVVQDSTSGIWTQIGIMAFADYSDSCAEAVMNYALYTKVSACIDFIKKYVPGI